MTTIKRPKDESKQRKQFGDMSLEEQEDHWKDKIKRIKKAVKNQEIIKVKQEAPSFKCRLCKHDIYTPLYGNTLLIPLGGKLYPIAYCCAKCSVVFTDPKEFSMKE